jgi:hypothetical protein
MAMVCWQFSMKKQGAKRSPKQANKNKERQERFLHRIPSLFSEFEPQSVPFRQQREHRD